MLFCVAVNEELMSSGLFDVMSTNTDEDEHSIEMQLPYIAKVMQELVFYIVHSILLRVTDIYNKTE